MPLSGFQSDYDPDGWVPKVGTRWIWEIDSPDARELIEVVKVEWNGEQWWIKTKALGGISLVPLTSTGTNEFLNELSRFWEAVTPVGGEINTRFKTKHKVQEGKEISFA